MKCTLIGMGCGGAHLTQAAQAALAEADLVIGAQRVLEMVHDTGEARSMQDAVRGVSKGAGGVVTMHAERVAEYRPTEIAAILRERAADVTSACVLYSGDSGFYSGAAGLLPLLENMDDMVVRVLPGISSLQEFAALLGESWQDWRLCSAHGADCDPVYEVMQGRSVFFLTSGAAGPRTLCTALAEAGLGTLEVAVGENLGGDAVQVWKGTAAECSTRDYAALNVMRVAAAPRYPQRTPGIPDEAFVRGRGSAIAQQAVDGQGAEMQRDVRAQGSAMRQIPMTKQEVRAAILAKLAVTPDDVCWDIGAGTGSVSVELALQARSAWAVEQKAEAVELIRQNRERFGAWNLHVVAGTAPEALAELPRPDVVFIGGSSGQLEAILQAAVAANPAARICVSAIALETLQQAMTCLERLGCTPSVTQIAVSRTRGVGSLHLLMAQNPVFLITGERS